MKIIELPTITIREIEESDTVCLGCKYQYKAFCQLNSSGVPKFCPYQLEKIVIEQNNINK